MIYTCKPSRSLEIKVFIDLALSTSNSTLSISCPSLQQKKQKTSAPTWKFNMEHKFMEVWFRWFSFSFGWFLGETCQFSGVYTLRFSFFWVGGHHPILKHIRRDIKWPSPRSFLPILSWSPAMPVKAYCLKVCLHGSVEDCRDLNAPTVSIRVRTFELSKNVKIWHGKRQ